MFDSKTMRSMLGVMLILCLLFTHDVIANTSQLTDEDRAAIAAYLKVVPGVADPATQ